MQETVSLSDNRGAIKLTTAKYYLPKGDCIHGKGVIPDRVVTLTAKERAEMIESRKAVYAIRGEQPATQPATSTAPATTSSPSRAEIAIDRQLREGLEVLRGQLATRPAEVGAG